MPIDRTVQRRDRSCAPNLPPRYSKNRTQRTRGSRTQEPCRRERQTRAGRNSHRACGVAADPQGDTVIREPDRLATLLRSTGSPLPGDGPGAPQTSTKDVRPTSSNRGETLDG